jgi:hypothetical protein
MRNISQDLRSQLIETERELKNLLPFNGSLEAKKRFKKLEGKTKEIQSRINWIEKRDRIERTKSLWGWEIIN